MLTQVFSVKLTPVQHSVARLGNINSAVAVSKSLCFVIVFSIEELVFQKNIYIDDLFVVLKKVFIRVGDVMAFASYWAVGHVTKKEVFFKCDCFDFFAVHFYSFSLVNTVKCLDQDQWRCPMQMDKFNLLIDDYANKLGYRNWVLSHYFGACKTDESVWLVTDFKTIYYSLIDEYLRMIARFFYVSMLCGYLYIDFLRLKFKWLVWRCLLKSNCVGRLSTGHIDVSANVAKKTPQLAARAIALKGEVFLSGYLCCYGESIMLEVESTKKEMQLPCIFTFFRYVYISKISLPVCLGANVSYQQLFVNKVSNTPNFLIRCEVNFFKKNSFFCANEVLAFGIPHLSKQTVISIVQLHLYAPQNLTINPLAKLMGRNCSLIQSIVDKACGQLLQAFLLHTSEGFTKGGFFLLRYSVAFNDLSIDHVADRVGVELDGHGTENGRKTAVVFQEVDSFGCNYYPINKSQAATFYMYGIHAYQFVLIEVIQVVKNLFFVSIKFAHEVIAHDRRIPFRQLYKQLFLKFSIKHDSAVEVIYE